MREYMIALFQEVRSVARLQMQLSAAIRGELNLTTDMAAYETRLQENFERMDNAVQGLLAHLEEGEQFVQAEAASRLGLTPSRSEEHTSELQSLMRISSAVFY